MQVGAPPPEMTVASVDAALEEVRPYLLADGGDVAVVGVEAGVVAVALQGACSSCASSSATLKMGIERQLRAVFGEQLREVVQVRLGGGRLWLWLGGEGHAGSKWGVGADEAAAVAAGDGPAGLQWLWWGGWCR